MATHSVTSSLNILVVEDDDNLREAMLDALESRGHVVRGVDCAEALPEQADLMLLDCAILDLNLPSEDGIALAKRLRQAQPELGIVIFSGRVRSEDKTIGYASGADIYLTKPASLEELIQAVSSLARRLAKPLGESNALTTLCLDLRALMLRHQGNNVSVTKTEAALLTAFVRSSQHTLETWQVATVMGMDLDTLKKSQVELHISRLRKKFPRNSEVVSPIRAVRGMGYQLCVPIELAS